MVVARLTMSREQTVIRVRRAAERGFAQAGKQGVGEIRTSLSTPYPPPSRRGEWPHKRTGDLRDSHDFDVRSTGPLVRLAVGPRRSSPAQSYLVPLHRSRPWMTLYMGRRRLLALALVAVRKAWR